MKKKILLTTVGTLGDLNPLIALGKILKREYNVSIATTSYYESNVSSAGIKFIEVAPHYNPKDPKLCEAILHPTKTLLNIHKYIWTTENIKQSIDEFSLIVGDYDLVIGNTFSYTAKIACKMNEVKWGSINLSPTCFFSAFDPPELYPLNILSRWPKLHQFFFKYGIRALFTLVDYWGREVHKSYQENSLGRAGNLLLDAPLSHEFNLVLFPEILGSIQADWPKNTYQTSFLLYSGEEHKSLDQGIMDFINRGNPPVLFTFGSTVGLSTESFLPKIIEVIKRLSLNERVIITLNKSDRDKYGYLFNENVFLCEYLPYDIAMKYMSLVIHQGGVGTVSSCLLVGVKQLLLPACTDQFDNAFRIKRAGLGGSIPLKKLSVDALYKRIEQTLLDKSMEIKCRAISEELSQRDVKAEINEIFAKALK